MNFFDVIEPLKKIKAEPYPIIIFQKKYIFDLFQQCSEIGVSYDPETYFNW